MVAGRNRRRCWQGHGAAEHPYLGRGHAVTVTGVALVTFDSTPHPFSWATYRRTTIEASWLSRSSSVAACN
jgi:hypothetical protein